MQPGTVAKFNLSSKLEAYLATKAGMYCDVAEKLVFNHLEKDDQVSFMITPSRFVFVDADVESMNSACSQN